MFQGVDDLDRPARHRQTLMLAAASWRVLELCVRQEGPQHPQHRTFKLIIRQAVPAVGQIPDTLAVPDDTGEVASKNAATSTCASPVNDALQPMQIGLRVGALVRQKWIASRNSGARSSKSAASIRYVSKPCDASRLKDRRSARRWCRFSYHFLIAFHFRGG